MAEFTKKNIFILAMLVFLGSMIFAGFSVASESGEVSSHFNISKEIYKWINFLILAGVLFFVLKKIVPDFFSSRVENIKQTLRDSQKAESEASEKLKAAEEQIKNLNKEIEIIRSNSQASIEKEKIRIIDEANEKVARITEQNEQNMKQEYEMSINELKKEMIDKAALLAENIIKGNITSNDKKKLFNKYLDNLGDVK